MEGEEINTFFSPFVSFGSLNFSPFVSFPWNPGQRAASVIYLSKYLIFMSYLLAIHVIERSALSGGAEFLTFPRFITIITNAYMGYAQAIPAP